MKMPISKVVIYVFSIAKTNVSIFSDICVVPNRNTVCKSAQLLFYVERLIACLFIYLSIFLSVCLSVCPSVPPSVRPILSIYLSLDYSRARAYCACRRCGWVFFLTFLLSTIRSFFFLPLFGRRPDIEILSQRTVKPKTNQPTKLYLQCYQNHAVFHSLSIYLNMRIYLFLFGLIRKKTKSMKN